MTAGKVWVVEVKWGSRDWQPCADISLTHDGRMALRRKWAGNLALPMSRVRTVEYTRRRTEPKP